MSTKVQPAHEASNPADTAESGEWHEFNASVRRAQPLFRRRRRAAMRDERHRRGPLVPNFDALPNIARGPTWMSSFSPTEEALLRLIRSIETALQEAQEHPDLLFDLNRVLETAASALDFSATPIIHAEKKPTPEAVLDLFEASSRACETLGRTLGRSPSEVVAHVAAAVASIRAHDQLLRRAFNDTLSERTPYGEAARKAQAEARVFGRWFGASLAEFRRAPSQNGRATSMSEGFPSQCGAWLSVDALRVAIRDCDRHRRAPIRARRLLSLAGQIEEYARMADPFELLELIASNAPLDRILALVAANETR